MPINKKLTHVHKSHYFINLHSDKFTLCVTDAGLAGDWNHETDEVTARYTLGYVFMFAGCLLTWGRKLHICLGVVNIISK